MAPRLDTRPLVRAALVAHFAASPEHPLATALEGRFAYGRAVPGWGLPFGIFGIPGVRQAGPFAGQKDDMELRFQFWGRTSVQVEQLCGHCLDLFEGRFFTAPGLEPFQLELIHTPETQEERVQDLIMWRAALEMDALIGVL